jgi:hypothetical protein
MSKFLLNLLLQISKALVYSKIKFLFGKDFFLHFRPNRPNGQPAQLRPTCFFFNRPLLLSPQGLSISAGPARPLGPADRASVAPCLIAASHSKKRKLQKPPSPSSSHHRNMATAAAGLTSPRPGCLVLLT